MKIFGNVTIVLALCVLIIASGCMGQEGREAEYSYSSPVDVSNDTINKITQENWQTLFRYLTGNSEWRVWIDPDNGDLVAWGWGKDVIGESLFERLNKKNKLSASLISIILEKHTSLVHKKKNTPLTEVVPGNLHVVLEMKKEDLDNGGFASELLLKGDLIELLIHETSWDRNREYTQEVIKAICKELQTVLDNEDELKRTGYIEGITPKGSVIRSKKTIMKVHGDQEYHKVKAYVNEGEPGYVYVKVFEEKTNKQLSARTNSVNSLQYVGWSDNKEHKFLYRDSVIVYEGGFQYKRKARFELWFHPEKGGKERKLAEVERMTTGWER